jgi:hypothetical protein
LARAKRCSCGYGDEPWAEGSARADALATAGDRHDAPTSERMREPGCSVDFDFYASDSNRFGIVEPAIVSSVFEVPP